MCAAAAPQQGGGGRGRRQASAGQATPGQLPADVDPKYVALGAVAVLDGFGVPVLTADLLATLGLLASAARREGGCSPQEDVCQPGSGGAAAAHREADEHGAGSLRARGAGAPRLVLLAR